MNYSILISPYDGSINGIKSGNLIIPLDPANSDYQRVLDDILEQGADCFEGDIPAELQAAADAKQLLMDETNTQSPS